MSSEIVRHKSTDKVRDVKREQLYPLEVEDPDDLANLPPDQVVTHRRQPAGLSEREERQHHACVERPDEQLFGCSHIRLTFELRRAANDDV